MAIVITKDVFCDFHDGIHGCGVWEHGTVGANPTAAEARTAAAKAGWVVKHGPSSCAYDLCDVHSDEVPGETFPDWRKPSPSTGG